MGCYSMPHSELGHLEFVGIWIQFKICLRIHNQQWNPTIISLYNQTPSAKRTTTSNSSKSENQDYDTVRRQWQAVYTLDSHQNMETLASWSRDGVPVVEKISG